MAAPLIAVGCWDWGDDNHNEYCQQKITTAGNDYLHGFNTLFDPWHWGIYGIALDSAGNVYAGSWLQYYTATTETPNPATLRKLNHDGDTLWRINQGSMVHNLTLDDAGDLYVVNDPVSVAGVQWVASYENKITYQTSRAGYYTLRKYSPAGALQWAADHPSPLNHSDGMRMPLAVKNGYVYTGCWWNAIQGCVIKWNATSGAMVWGTEQYAGSVVHGIAVDDDDNVYVAGNLNYVDAIRKYDSSGTLVASVAKIGTTYARHIAINGDGDIVACFNVTNLGPIGPGGENQYSPALRKYDADLSLLLEQDTADSESNTVNALALDSDGRAYLCLHPSTGFVSQPPTLMCYGADFVRVWYRATADTDNTSSIEPYCLSIRDVEMPALRLPVAYGLPALIGDLYSPAPALALAMGLPRPLREYVGIARPAVYRLFLTGTPALELPMQYFQCRRTATGLYLSVNGPLPDSDTLDIIAASAGDLVIYRGVRLTDGSEIIDELLRAPFTRLRYDVGRRSATLSLEGETATVEVWRAARTLAGITYRNEQDGRRRVRCAVDTYLRIGDTVNLGGGETMVAAEIVYSVSPTQASMEVVE